LSQTSLYSFVCLAVSLRYTKLLLDTLCTLNGIIKDYRHKDKSRLKSSERTSEEKNSAQQRGVPGDDLDEPFCPTFPDAHAYSAAYPDVREHSAAMTISTAWKRSRTKRCVQTQVTHVTHSHVQKLHPHPQIQIETQTKTHAQTQTQAIHKHPVFHAGVEAETTSTQEEGRKKGREGGRKGGRKEVRERSDVHLDPDQAATIISRSWKNRNRQQQVRRARSSEVINDCTHDNT
jgi:hypothetical protein